MLDRKALKLQGLRYARSLQTLLKTVNIFSVDHQSVSVLLQRSYEQLNPLLKQVSLLTLGFVDQRFLLNSILTTEDSLKPLENDLLKRGIGAVTFEAGLTLAAYKKAVAALAVPLKVLDECGGLLPFLEQHQLEFVRIFPAIKNETRNAEGDTLLDMGSEEYLISKAMGNLNSGFSQGVESMLTHLAASDRESAYGVVNYVAGPGGSTGPGSGSHRTASSDSSAPAAPGTAPRDQAFQGSFMEIQRAVEQKFEASLANPDEDPEKAFVELGKMLSNVRTDLVYSQLLNKGAETQRGSKEEVTAEIFEETAIRWALRRLAAVPTGEDAVIVEEQVFRVLMRSLQATHTASRLAQKLAEYAKEYALPKPTLERIQDEIRWLSLTTQQKLRELLALTHFSPAEFRRALDLIKDLLKQGKSDSALALGLQYFSVFDDHVTIRIEDVGRVPELLRALSGILGEFWKAAAACLGEALVSVKLNQLIHVQVVNSMVALARIAATYEDFQIVNELGTALAQSCARESGKHLVCCGAATASLLQPSAVDRIGEIYLEKKNDPSWLRLACSVLHWANPDSLERLFIRLDGETIASNRLAFLRLISRVGPSAIQAARRRLTHPEWYVVRNACKLLGDLKDPELLLHIAPALAHKDERVQKAALHAIMETRLPGSAAVLAEELISISPILFDEALGELIFQADARCLPALEKCFQPGTAVHSNQMKKLLTVIAAIREVSAADLLAGISRDQKLDPEVRKAAQQALSLRQQRNLQRWLAQQDGEEESAALLPRAPGFARA